MATAKEDGRIQDMKNASADHWVGSRATSARCEERDGGFDLVQEVSVGSMEGGEIVFQLPDDHRCGYVLERMVLGGDVGDFDVTDVRVGGNSQPLSVGSVPASFFSETSCHRPTFDLVPASRSLAVLARNNADVVRGLTFRLRCRTTSLGERRSGTPVGYVGLGRTPVEPGRSVRISVSPLCVVKIFGIVVDSGVGGHFTVGEVELSGGSAWHALGGAEASLMSEDKVFVFASSGDDWIVQVGSTVDVVVKNCSSSVQVFRGALLAKICE